MNQKVKAILLCLVLVAMVVFAAGCAQEKTPYQINDTENFTVSVKYDANGGVFTTNTSVITDSYNISGMETNSDGMVELPLCAPDDEARGKSAFAPAKNGYFLAGWYTQRTETGKDEAGQSVYTYSGKWDFAEDRLKVDPAGEYTSQTPEITLYAAWVPLFEIEFYDKATGELMDTVTYDPTVQSEFSIPEWSQETGAVEMYKFPQKSGYTFNGVYYDADGKTPVDTAYLQHPGAVDDATGTAKDISLAVYVDWLEGEWYHIYTAQQFLDNASVSGSYVIHADLDFIDEVWPTSLMHGTYTGTIQGNGHTFKNIVCTQTNNNKNYTGLFGQLAEGAILQDITFENVDFTIAKGARMAGAVFGLLVGSISEEAQCTGVNITNSTLKIDSSSAFLTEDYTIGLVCGLGVTQVDPSGITCEATGDAPEKVVITVSDTTVTLEFVTD